MRTASPIALSGAANPSGSRPFGARLDLELHSLTTGKPVEVERRVEAGSMEEVFLLIVGGDEAEAAIGNDLLDSTAGHSDLHVLEH